MNTKSYVFALVNSDYELMTFEFQLTNFWPRRIKKKLRLARTKLHEAKILE